jgi:hypothetical protein
MNRKIIESQPQELLRLATNFFRKTHASLPVVERVWDPKVGSYVLYARQVLAARGDRRGRVVALLSAALCRAAAEGRVYLSSPIYDVASEAPSTVRPPTFTPPRVFVPFALTRRRPFALATRARVVTLAP